MGTCTEMPSWRKSIFVRAVNALKFLSFRLLPFWTTSTAALPASNMLPTQVCGAPARPPSVSHLSSLRSRPFSTPLIPLQSPKMRRKAASPVSLTKKVSHQHPRLGRTIPPTNIPFEFRSASSSTAALRSRWEATKPTCCGP